MKTLFLKKGKTELRYDHEFPKLGKGEAIVKMMVCGLCGTDIEKIHGEYIASKPIIGHEAVGIITKIDDNVNNFKIGDRVFPHHHTPCYKCRLCKMGSETMCDKYKSSNLEPGGFSEYFKVPSWNINQGGLLKIPDSVNYEEASFIEPVACCIRGLNRCGITKHDKVLVIGAGPIGLTHVQILNQMHVEIMVSDINDSRLNFAKTQRVSQTYDARDINIPQKVKDNTDGLGADIAIIASGNPKAIVQGLKSVRKGGKICLFGVPIIGSRLDYDFSSVFNSEISIISSYGATKVEIEAALQLIKNKRINPSSLISHRFRLEQFNEAIKTAIKGNCLKILITP